MVVSLVSGADASPPGGTQIATDDAGASGHVQLFKLAYSAAGVVTLVPVDANGLLVNTELPAAAVLSDAVPNPTAPSVAAHMLGYFANGADNWQRVTAREPLTASDGFPGPGYSLNVAAHPLLWNGASMDRQRNNTKGTLLASAARAATTYSSDQINHNGRGIQVMLNVTVASGTGGLQVSILGINPITLQGYALNAPTTPIVATGQYVYEVCPGASAAGAPGSTLINQRTAGMVPRDWLVAVVPGDGSSYTYSLAFAAI